MLKSRRMCGTPEYPKSAIEEGMVAEPLPDFRFLNKGREMVFY